ncbi:MAG: transglycosylase domain-containing protein [Hyphomicrobiaceae bacterium]|nr:transglycosylase domain-containing protein [Hyphomicrobiaceae bacterium]
MLVIIRTLTRILEYLLAVPVRLLRAATIGVAFNPRLGPLRHIATAAYIYILFALVLVYVVAPIRGYVGAAYLSEKIGYDAERWLATAIYDRKGSFIGTFDPRLDSKRDVNFTGKAIEHAGYTANPDHKSIPVQTVPEAYWGCLSYHEDRYIGTLINPFGIDLIGVLKIPYSSFKRTIQRRRISFGVGGSTLPMQLSRVIYKTPPRRGETAFEKLGRKFGEWWMAPVIYRSLVRGGDDTMLRQWSANHLWLAQRTGGAPLHGIEVTSRIVFGKEAKDLSPAEQFVLASAVNKPIILLDGNERISKVRLDRWRYIVEVRARQCANVLIADEAERKAALFELVAMASGPPDPKVRPALVAALEKYAPRNAQRAQANPRIRANILMPSARLGIREEMKQAFGFNWRRYVRGITTTLDVGDNLALRRELLEVMRKLDGQWRSRLGPDFTLDPGKAGGTPEAGGKEMPNVIVVAANARGEIVRYFENSELAPYFGSVLARDRNTGNYVAAREPRQIASTGKMLAAIAIANQLRDTTGSIYLDTHAPARGLETCRRNGNLRLGRRAEVAFACSLNGPLEWRTARAGQRATRYLIDTLGFTMPPAPDPSQATPPSTAAVRGLISGSPRRVHMMAATVLASLTGRGGAPQHLPSLVRRYDFTRPEHADLWAAARGKAVTPNQLIRPAARALVKAFLSAPLCYQDGRGNRYGTLKGASDWCARRNKEVRLHIAKSGTAVTTDPDATVDAWIAGGIQFASGAQYSYVIVVGTGDASRPFGRRLHSSQLGVPLLNALLEDLRRDARRYRVAAPRSPRRESRPRVAEAPPKKRKFSIQSLLESQFFNSQ